ncbi:MAG TPA: hypothetical protein VFA32_21575, partial [Dehalococcoidia bacterium]|nr:hypothetical protein [Dehalococcoidia bacterium]
MQPPTEANKALIILVLRTLGVSQDNVAQMARCRKAVVSETELWFSSGLSYSQAVTFADDQTIRQIAAREFAFCGLTEEGLEKAQRITGDDILRHFRIGDYLASSSKEASGEQGHVQSLAQRAMEAHFQKLFHYGQRLRDR